MICLSSDFFGPIQVRRLIWKALEVRIPWEWVIVDACTARQTCYRWMQRVSRHIRMFTEANTRGILFWIWFLFWKALPNSNAKWMPCVQSRETGHFDRELRSKCLVYSYASASKLVRCYGSGRQTHVKGTRLLLPSRAPILTIVCKWASRDINRWITGGNQKGKRGITALQAFCVTSARGLKSPASLSVILPQNC